MRSINAKKAPRPMSEYWAAGGTTSQIGRHDQEDRRAEDEQVLKGLVAPERSHGHETEISGPAGRATNCPEQNCLNPLPLNRWSRRGPGAVPARGSHTGRS